MPNENLKTDPLQNYYKNMKTFVSVLNTMLLLSVSVLNTMLLLSECWKWQWRSLVSCNSK